MMDDQAMWESSAPAWMRNIARGDRNRTQLLDSAALRAMGPVAGQDVLDVGCGEGRFCRILGLQGACCVGIEPAPTLLGAARAADPAGEYREGRAETLPVADGGFNWAVYYLVLLDVAGYRDAVDEAFRALRPRGRCLVIDVTPFRMCSERGWECDAEGGRKGWLVHDYARARPIVQKWSGIEVVNYHRPLGEKFAAFLGAGFVLERYGEVIPESESPENADEFDAPNFDLAVWRKP